MGLASVSCPNLGQVPRAAGGHAVKLLSALVSDMPYVCCCLWYLLVVFPSGSAIKSLPVMQETRV